MREEEEVPADLLYSPPLYRLAGEDAVVAAMLGERQPDLLTLPASSYRLFSQVSHATVICGLLLRCVQVHQLLKEYDSEAGQAEMVVFKHRTPVQMSTQVRMGRHYWLRQVLLSDPGPTTRLVLHIFLETFSQPVTGQLPEYWEGFQHLLVKWRLWSQQDCRRCGLWNYALS